MSRLHAKLFFVLCLSASAVVQFVTLDNATFVGTTLGLVTRYLGIPYAEPPISVSGTGDRRFRLPVAKSYTSGTFPAAVFDLVHEHESKDFAASIAAYLLYTV
ncbi:hypothetical protein JB92DRAFT_2827008 [Gautieria morchelliformis]|nr:hypothetical protein JB92DRAFT_2827008 [Gautieria morchelliformis]